MHNSFEQFDALPGDAMVGIDVLCRMVGIGKTTVRKHIRSGVLPPPFVIGKLHRWRVGVLREFLAMRATSKRYPPQFSEASDRLAAAMAGCETAPVIPPYPIGESVELQNSQER